MERKTAPQCTDGKMDEHSKEGKMDTAPLIFRRDALSAKGRWPISERARWLPALAIAICIIYGADVSRADRPSAQPPPAE